jgi:hypothetical protein
MPPDPKEALEWSAAMYLAEVVKVEEAGRERGGLLVRVRDREDVPGVRRAEGGKDKPLHVSPCSRTRTRARAAVGRDFKALSEGTSPKKEGRLSRSPP